MLDQIMDYEMGELGEEETVQLFARLVKNGMAWTLQGHYGRTANMLIQAGYISESGEVMERDE